MLYIKTKKIRCSICNKKTKFKGIVGIHFVICYECYNRKDFLIDEAMLKDINRDIKIYIELP